MVYYYLTGKKYKQVCKTSSQLFFGGGASLTAFPIIIFEDDLQPSNTPFS